MTLGLTNNLFERSRLWVIGDFDFAAYNNLFWRNWISFECSRATPWRVCDNAFDSGYARDAGSYGVAHGYNAFINGTNALYAITPNTDLTLTSFTYASGFLGDYYQSSTNLVDRGSRSAADAGLFHYTVSTNLVGNLQVKEGTSTVDVGFHFVATSQGAAPLDTDGDGIADVLEDANGNGSFDGGDLADFNDSDTDNDGVPDGIEVLQGRNPKAGAVPDTTGATRLDVYTPLR
jgi:hypothetical protein